MARRRARTSAEGRSRPENTRGVELAWGWAIGNAHSDGPESGGRGEVSPRTTHVRYLGACELN